MSEVTPHAVSMQSVDEIYALLRRASTCKQPIAARSTGTLDYSVRTYWEGARKAGDTLSVISLGEQVTAG